MKILNFGSCNIDYVYSVDHIVLPGETLSASGMEVFPGGKGLNQSVAAARAGARVYHAGVVGKDGAMLRQVLSASGADTSFLETADCANGHAIIQLSKSAQNSIFLFEGTNGMITEKMVDRVLAHFASGDILLLQNEISNVPYLIRRGKEKGMTVVFNPAPFDKSLLQLDLHNIDYLILNEVEASGFFGTEDVGAIAQKAAQWPELKLVVTLGKKGCVFISGDSVLPCPAFQVDAVDTTAAGDTFTGFFVSMICNGSDSAKAIRYACAASALAVSAMGAAPSIPTMEQVEAALTWLKPYPGREETKQARLRRKMLAYMEAEIKTADLPGLAKELGYSESYTGTLVRELTGQTFGALLQKLRCQSAARALRETETPVSTVIHSVGYQNESFFRTAFKAQYGKTPLQYRKQWTGGKKDDQ